MYGFSSSRDVNPLTNSYNAQSAKKRSDGIVQDLLHYMQPTDTELRIIFQRYVGAALRNLLKKRLNSEFVKLRWFKDVVNNRFQKCEVK